ncbi:MAG: Npt1/Npt2 family nucleotide transporter [Phycisphaerales bacterium]
MVELLTRVRDVDSTTGAWLERALARGLLLRAGEGRRLLLAGTYFFLLLASYYMIRPIRDQMGVAGGVKNLSWLMTATLLAMLVANPIYAAVVSRLPRRRFVPLVYRFFALNILVFYALLLAHPTGAAAVWTGRVFYVWSSVFNLFVVSVFWSVMADAHTIEQAKRLFGAIGVGGTLGAIVGSSAIEALGRLAESGATMQLSPLHLLPVAALLLEGAVRCFRSFVRSSAVAPTTSAAPHRAGAPAGSPPIERSSAAAAMEASAGGRRAGPEPTSDMWAGFVGLVRSPYLLSICLYMLLFTITGTLLYVEQARVVDEALVGTAAQTRYFARVDLVTNALTLLLQVAVTGRLVTRIGLPATLLVLPLLTLAGFGALLAAPSLVLVGAFQVVRRASHYAVDRPAREALFTVLSADDKYKTKAFIDTFVYRTGDAIGAWAPRAVAKLATTPAAAATAATLLAGALAVGWLVNGVVLGRQHLRRAGAKPGESSVRPGAATGAS